MIRPGQRHPARGLLAAVLILRLAGAPVLIAGLTHVGCEPASTTTPNAIQPYRLEAIEGSDLKRVVLTAEAAARIGIQTSTVREVPVARKSTFGGEVVSLDDGALLLVRATPSDLTKIDRGQEAVVRPIVRSPSGALAAGLPAMGSTTITARVAKAPADAPNSTTLYYLVDGQGHGLARGQRVFLVLPLTGGTAVRKVAPYSAVLYDLSGSTWMYTRSAALTFVRERVSVDYIEGDQAILSEGPTVGTEVVVVGATQLFGTELKVGG